MNIVLLVVTLSLLGLGPFETGPGLLCKAARLQPAISPVEKTIKKTARSAASRAPVLILRPARTRTWDSVTGWQDQ